MTTALYRMTSPPRLGCHFRARMSARWWEHKRIIRHYLHRWPSQKAMAPGQAGQWTEDWFNGHGLFRLRGTMRYPKAQ